MSTFLCQVVSRGEFQYPLYPFVGPKYVITRFEYKEPGVGEKRKKCNGKSEVFLFPGGPQGDSGGIPL